MTTEMFGAPFGISAAEDQINENALASVKALHTLGEIQQQPADLALKQAHARYYGGLAAEAEGKARDLEVMQKLEEGLQAAKVAAAKGQILTVAEPGTSAAAKSLAAPLEQMLQYGDASGAPARLLAPLAEKASLIRQHEASAGSAQAEEQVRKLDAAQKHAQRVSAFAAAALATPAAYDQLKAQAASEGFQVNQLPQQWNAAALQGLRDSGIEADKQITLAREAIKEKAQEGRWASSNARDAASVKLSGARLENVKERTKQLVKNGGEGSPEAKAAKEELRLSREALRKARDRKEFPPAPLDPAAREFEKQYSAANGARFLWSKDPATGKGVAVLLSPPPGTKAAAGIASLPAGKADAESSDEDAGEGEEE
jgi:hypothetical protein